MKFKIETHLHTSEGSLCGGSSGAEHAEIRKQEGYDAIIVTDHLFKGNTRPDRNLPWEEYVNQFCEGYENAKKKGDEIGLKVFFGWEDNFNGAEMLVYGLDKQFLLDHPDIRHWTAEEAYKIEKEAGAYIVQAHPFRERGYLMGILLYPNYCDAVEICNSCNYERENNRAKWYADQFDKPYTGGSDIHHKWPIGGGMIFDHEINCIEDYIEAIKNRQGQVIMVHKND